MSETPDPSVTITDLNVENAVLRGHLFLTARVLKDYRDARHVKGDDDTYQLTVPRSITVRADEALARAGGILRGGKERQPGRE